MGDLSELEPREFQAASCWHSCRPRTTRCCRLGSSPRRTWPRRKTRAFADRREPQRRGISLCNSLSALNWSSHHSTARVRSRPPRTKKELVTARVAFHGDSGNESKAERARESSAKALCDRERILKWRAFAVNLTAYRCWARLDILSSSGMGGVCRAPPLQSSMANGELENLWSTTSAGSAPPLNLRLEWLAIVRQELIIPRD